MNNLLQVENRIPLPTLWAGIQVPHIINDALIINGWSQQTIINLIRWLLINGEILVNFKLAFLLNPEQTEYIDKIQF